MKRNISDLAGSWDIGDEEVREIKKTLKKKGGRLGNPLLRYRHTNRFFKRGDQNYKRS